MRDYSYGVIPLRRSAKGEWEILLIQHHAGHWSFPKGHADPGETPLEAAARELEEEAGLVIESFLSEEPIRETYFFIFQKKRVFKTVDYFMALVKGEVKIQEAEICNSCWLSIDQAIEKITFKQGKDVCLKVKQFLEGGDGQKDGTD